jgi:hypothetical protein
MRLLAAGEKKKRGCEWCAELGKKFDAHRGGMRLACPHRACPYTVLDKYDTYEDFLQSKESGINITALLDTNWRAGRVSPQAREYYPVLRRFGKDGLFHGK